MDSIATWCPFCGRETLIWRETQTVGAGGTDLTRDQGGNTRTLFRVGCPMCRVSMTEPGPWSMRNMDDHPSDEIAMQVLMMRWNTRAGGPMLNTTVQGDDPDPDLTRNKTDPQTHLN